MKDLFVYILTNKHRTTLYIGVTNDLERRLWQHQNGEGSLFAKKYRLDLLVFYEVFPEAAAAIAREKQLKNWTRAKKEALIATLNPGWEDLGAQLFNREPHILPRDSSTALHSAQNDGRESAGRER